MKKLAEWFLGELPPQYPKKRLRMWQGCLGVTQQLKKEDRREKLNRRLKHKAYPSGLIVRYVRRGIVLLNFLRVQVWIDEVRDRMAFRVLRRRRRTLEEIAGWRDRYHFLRFGYFAVILLGFSSLPWSLKLAAWIVSIFFLIDMLGGLLGSALVWYPKSVSYERSFMTSLLSYGEVVIAFAGFYRVCDCLNAPAPGFLQALYFSIVVSTTVGFGDIHPLNSTGVAPDGSCVPVNPWGLLLVVVQLTMAILFVLVFVNIFLARSLNPDNRDNIGPIARQKGRVE